MVNNEIPTKNWLSFPTVGTKGLPAALSQTWCNDESISFNLAVVILVLDSAVLRWLFACWGRSDAFVDLHRVSPEDVTMIWPHEKGLAAVPVSTDI
jgi:hypothetical protein